MAGQPDIDDIGLEAFQANTGRASALLKALSSPHRLMVLCQLGDRELSVGELMPAVGLSQSALSQHLAKLREEGLVDTRRDGTTIFYRIADPAVLKVIAVLAEIYCPPTSQDKE